MKAITFEKRNKDVYSVRSTIRYIADTAKNKQEVIDRIRDILPRDLKMGFGGHHIWCCNSNNQRLFIIYWE